MAVKCEDVKKLEPILGWLVDVCNFLLKEHRASIDELWISLGNLADDHAELEKRPTYEGLQKKINGLREELDGLRIHYQSTLKEIEELRKSKKERYTKYIS